MVCDVVEYFVEDEIEGGYVVVLCGIWLLLWFGGGQLFVDKILIGDLFLVQLFVWFDCFGVVVYYYCQCDGLFICLFEFGLVVCYWCMQVKFIVIDELMYICGCQCFGIGQYGGQCVVLLGLGIVGVGGVVLQVDDKIFVDLYCDGCVDFVVQYKVVFECVVYFGEF